MIMTKASTDTRKATINKSKKSQTRGFSEDVYQRDLPWDLLGYEESKNEPMSKLRLQNELADIEKEVIPIIEGDHHPLTKELVRRYATVQEEYILETNDVVMKAKGLEADLLDEFFEEFNEDGKSEIEIGIELLSGLIYLQALPNTNHRSTFKFVHWYLDKKDVIMKVYIGNESLYNSYGDNSKRIISRSITELRGYSIRREEHYRKQHLLMTNRDFHNFLSSTSTCVTRDEYERIYDHWGFTEEERISLRRTQGMASGFPD